MATRLSTSDFLSVNFAYFLCCAFAFASDFANSVFRTLRSISESFLMCRQLPRSACLPSFSRSDFSAEPTM